LLLQQPLAQLDGVQTHWPVVLQAWPPAHGEQLTPLAPHWPLAWLAYGTHTAPLQQPFGQVVPLQTQCPAPPQAAPEPHCAHEAPLVPQPLLVWLACGTQVVPLQQPLGQLVPSQTQWKSPPPASSQRWPLPHCALLPHMQPDAPQVLDLAGSQKSQEPPPVPQTVGGLVALWGLQVVPSQQPPGQEFESQHDGWPEWQRQRPPDVHSWSAWHSPTLALHMQLPSMQRRASGVLVSHAVQSAPLAPQASSAVPALHSPFTRALQQPAAQLTESQTQRAGEATVSQRCPVEQAAPRLPQTQPRIASQALARLPQSTQVLPPWPQAESPGVPTQCLLESQQPEQLAALHSHVPFWLHPWPETHSVLPPQLQAPAVQPSAVAAQLTHVAPPMPQRALPRSLPRTQVKPSTRQQPSAQVVLVHGTEESCCASAGGGASTAASSGGAASSGVAASTCTGVASCCCGKPAHAPVCPALWQ
jgi:hypothetical protein